MCEVSPKLTRFLRVTKEWPGAAGEITPISEDEPEQSTVRGAAGSPVRRQAGGPETAIYSCNVFLLPDWQTRD